MCKKDPESCKAKVKCIRCKEMINSNFIVDNDKQNGKLDLNEVDNRVEEQMYIINVKGDMK